MQEHPENFPEPGALGGAWKSELVEGGLEPNTSRGQTAPVCPAVLAGPRYLENLRSWLGSGGQPSPQHV